MTVTYSTNRNLESALHFQKRQRWAGRKLVQGEIPKQEVSVIPAFLYSPLSSTGNAEILVTLDEVAYTRLCPATFK